MTMLKEIMGNQVCPTIPEGEVIKIVEKRPSEQIKETDFAHYQDSKDSRRKAKVGKPMP
jgi:hypothetical protein